VGHGFSFVVVVAVPAAQAAGGVAGDVVGLVVDGLEVVKLSETGTSSGSSG